MRTPNSMRSLSTGDRPRANPFRADRFRGYWCRERPEESHPERCLTDPPSVLQASRKTIYTGDTVAYSRRIRATPTASGSYHGQRVGQVRADVLSWIYREARKHEAELHKIEARQMTVVNEA